MQDDASYTFRPIGLFHSLAKYTYDVPRQGALADANWGRIDLFNGFSFEDALYRLEGFSMIWVLFVFDRNVGRWKPRVLPPRHTTRKVGVFATRSPYRPNPIGLSCVQLVEIKGRSLTVAAHDLLDGTPILDIKPYLPYADAFPNATLGWTADDDMPTYEVAYTPLAEAQVGWLIQNGLPCLKDYISDRLANNPLDGDRNRLVVTPDEEHVLAYRTWRAAFDCDEEAKRLRVTRLFSGYTEAELAAGAEDTYADKDLHRQFNAQAWTAP